MFKNYTNIYRLSALVAALTLCLGLVVNGCGDDGDYKAPFTHSYNPNVSTVVVRIGCNPEEGQPGYGPASAIKYIIDLYGQGGIEVHGYADANNVDDTVFTNIYTEEDGIRNMLLTSRQEGPVYFRIKYYDANGNYLGSGYAQATIAKGKVANVDNNVEPPAFTFIPAVEEAANGELKVLPTEVNVGETITLTSMWVYDNVEYGEVEATYTMEDNQFATLEEDEVTGVAGGEAPLTATATLAEDAVVTQEVTITVIGPEPSPSPSPTASPEPSPTESPEPSPSPTESPEPSPSPTESPEPSPSPTESPEPSPSPTESPEPSPSPTESPEPSPSPTESPEPSPSPTESPSPSPTTEPTMTPSPTPTPTSMPTITPSPSYSPSPSPSPSSTMEP